MHIAQRTKSLNAKQNDAKYKERAIALLHHTTTIYISVAPYYIIIIKHQAMYIRYYDYLYF
jgi:hypothetical protein